MREWIERANRLQADIDHAQEAAELIHQRAKDVIAVHANIEDAEEKAKLLKIEVEYTTKLEDTLRHVQSVTEKHNAAESAIKDCSLLAASRQLQTLEQTLLLLADSNNKNAFELLSQRQARITSQLSFKVQDLWKSAVRSDSQGREVSIEEYGTTGPQGARFDLETMVALLSGLKLLDGNISNLHRNLNVCIFGPLMSTMQSFNADGIAPRVDERRLRLEAQNSHPRIEELIESLAIAISFLHNRLPDSVSLRLSQDLMPSLVNQLVTQVLPAAIPTTVDEIVEFKGLLNCVSAFTKKLSSIGWIGIHDLEEWVVSAPRNWLAKRKESSIAHVRILLSKGLRDTKVVERVETQLVAGGDLLASPRMPNDEWNESWSENGEPVQPLEQRSQKNEDDDTSAWDMEDEPQNSHSDHLAPISTSHEPTSADAADDGEAWGWDDHNPELSPTRPKKAPREHAQVNGDRGSSNKSEQEVTLRETYTITAIPDELLDLIMQVTRDAQGLRQPENASSPVAPAALGLYSVPTLILAGFRALAPAYYEDDSKIKGGNMFLYNDSMRLAETLSAFAAETRQADSRPDQPQHSWLSTRMKLESEISALQSFGRRAYGKEMESQRTTLRDQIDIAQGFVQCTEAPFAGECDNAVATTIDHLRKLEARYKRILSRSALLQSLGSLLSTVINKMILDIEDMSDIGEDESKRLRHFCNEISKLSDLFLQESEGGAKTDATGIYTPNWFKFQYLSEIMESTLADIKYLWTEGELKLEFDVEELVELIQALFADSDRRRKGIADIRSNY